MATVVFIKRLQPADGKRGELLLEELAYDTDPRIADAARQIRARAHQRDASS
jgi:hypothetical protein